MSLLRNLFVSSKDSRSIAATSKIEKPIDSDVIEKLALEAYWSPGHKLPGYPELQSKDLILCARVVGYATVSALKDNPENLGISRICMRIGLKLAAEMGLKGETFTVLICESQEEALPLESQARARFIEQGLPTLKKYLEENGPYTSEEHEIQFMLLSRIKERP